MVSSLDGYVASLDGKYDWMESKSDYVKGHNLSKEEIETFLSKIDCYLMGSVTYEKALQLGWPYGDTPVYVLSRRSLPVQKESVTILYNDLDKEIVILKENHQNIWMVGGPSLLKSLMELNKIDELVISLLPILLGEGLTFFQEYKEAYHLQLLKSVAYDTGMVEMTYSVNYLLE